MSNEQWLAQALVLSYEAFAFYLDLERGFERGEWTREQLERFADERELYYDVNTSDYNLFDGIRSSARANIEAMKMVVHDKIKVK
jgi:hypothetical protein